MSIRIDTGADVTRTGDASPVDGVVRELRDRIEDHRRRNARRAGWTKHFTPTGLVPLDRALPHGGVPNGAVLEILADADGVGASSLAMRLAAAMSLSRAVVVVDTRGDFYPPAVEAWGLALTQLIVIHTLRSAEAFWAIDQALRCRAVAVVIAPIAAVEERLSRRWQLAAESSGAVGLILAPAGRRDKSFAAIRMLVEGAAPAAAPEVPQHWHSPPAAPYLCRLTLLKVREGMPAGPLWLDLHHEAGDGLVHPVPLHRPAAKHA